MGVFLTILRLDFDALLPWPFNCPVTFTLMDQNTDDLAPSEPSKYTVIHSWCENIDYL